MKMLRAISCHEGHKSFISKGFGYQKYGAASATFVKQHFGFKQEMAVEGFISLSREDAGFNRKLGKDIARPSGLLVPFLQGRGYQLQLALFSQSK
jgi:hypothetical protein